MEGRTTWALPPQAPETWVGGRWAALLLGALVVSVLVPLRWLGAGLGGPVVAVAVVTIAIAAAAATCSYVLLLQASVTADVRLRAVAAGYAALVPLALLRGEHLGEVPWPLPLAVERAVPLTLLLLIVVPGAALVAAQARPRAPGLLLLVDVVALAALALLVLPERLPELVAGTEQEHRTGLRLALVAVAGAALLAARRSRRAAAAEVLERSTGPWAWLWVGLVLTAVAAAVSALATARWSGLWWTGLVTQALAVVVPALGLSLVSSAGYRKQSRRWRQLVAEVGQLRAASPLLPGLSVTPDDDEGLPEERDVRALIDEGRVRVALQPVVSLGDSEVVGYEALSRFGGRVPTDRWFRGASRCGLGGELERITLQAALELLAQLPDDVFLAVNVSPAALEDDTVRGLLHAADLTRVVVEVTEHEAVQDYRRVRAALEELRDQGARIAVDDTGAGFASLRHVLMLQPDVIKLDSSLTRDVHTSERQQSLVVALAGFAREVGSTVLAEGIETEEQLERLRALGVPLGQGWHLGVPTVVSTAEQPS